MLNSLQEMAYIVSLVVGPISQLSISLGGRWEDMGDRYIVSPKEKHHNCKNHNFSERALKVFKS